MERQSISKKNIGWLLESSEPWTAYRARLDLLGQSEKDPAVQSDRLALLSHPQIKSLIESATNWPGYALRRHNDAAHPLYVLSTLADFGLRASDPSMSDVIDSIIVHQSTEGAFLTPVNIPRAFGGTDDDQWAWILCDTPTLLYTLLAMGKQDDARVRHAAQHLAGLVQENGWHCVASPELGKFRGPGRKTDPCPIANVLTLKALSLLPEYQNSHAAHLGVEALLHHWEYRSATKFYLFGMGTDFLKLKYPFVWYDLLHVVEVLSRFPFIRSDVRFIQMVDAVLVQADLSSRFTAGSMYQSWKGWSFANKKNPSPWLTFLVYRILHRINNQ
jgi:hypothetical protein